MFNCDIDAATRLETRQSEAEPKQEEAPISPVTIPGVRVKQQLWKEALQKTNTHADEEGERTQNKTNWTTGAAQKSDPPFPLPTSRGRRPTFSLPDW